MATDASGRYAVTYRRWHLIGLELGVPIAAVATRREPTGCPIAWNADAVAVAKRGLTPDEVLDGEGGYTVRGKLIPASQSLAHGAVPIALANKIAVTHLLQEGQLVTWADVVADETVEAYRLRREMEALVGATT